MVNGYFSCIPGRLLLKHIRAYRIHCLRVIFMQHIKTQKDSQCCTIALRLLFCLFQISVTTFVFSQKSGLFEEFTTHKFTLNHTLAFYQDIIKFESNLNQIWMNSQNFVVEMYEYLKECKCVHTLLKCK